VLAGLLDARRLTNLIAEGWALVGRATASARDQHLERNRPPSKPAVTAADRLDAARDRLKGSIAAPDEPGG
jgi:hypothetical protein